MKEKDNGRGRMKFIKTVHQDNTDEFYDEARKVYTIERFQPYGVAVVFSNMVADYVININRKHIDVVIPSELDVLLGSEKPEIIVNLIAATGRTFV